MHFQRLDAGACYDPDSVLCLDDNAAAEFVSGALAAAAVSKVEQHLAGCRDCRALVAALAAGGDVDSQAQTRQVERISESQAGKLPKKLAIGDRVGRYLVLSALGAGGMGVVFAAYDPQLDRKVALKVLRANLGANTKEARARLKREAQAIARLSHPNVVGVYEVGAMDDGDVYIAMEFVEGDTLTTWLKRWPRSWREILEVFHQAGRGLAAAHSVGLLHRDFKPDNVLVGGDGRVRVTDFGLARSVVVPEGPAEPGPLHFRPEEVAHPRPEASPLHAELTATGTVLGTPRYMAPEQLTGPDIDARSDQFSFCVALYEALYGTHPLPDASAASMLEHDAPASAPPEHTRVPAAIGRAVQRGLARDRARRFPSMEVLLAALVAPVERPVARIAIGAGLVLAIAAVATAAVMRRPDPVPRQPAADQAALDEIKQLRAERDRLEAQLKDLLDKHTATTQELEQVKQQLVDLNDKYNKALDELTRATAQNRPKPHPTVDAQVQQAVTTAQHDLEGCFDEWSSRQALPAVEGWQPPQPKEAELFVRLSVTPTGIGNSAEARGELEPRRDGTAAPVHGVLSFCVEQAIERVPYPTGPDSLDLEVEVVWEAPGMVNTTARVLGHHAAPEGGLDLQ